MGGAKWSSNISRCLIACGYFIYIRTCHFRWYFMPVSLPPNNITFYDRIQVLRQPSKKKEFFFILLSLSRWIFTYKTQIRLSFSFDTHLCSFGILPPVVVAVTCTFFRRTRIGNQASLRHNSFSFYVFFSSFQR